MRLADEQWAEEQRRIANRRRRREQPVGEQLLIDEANENDGGEGVDVAAEDHVAVEEENPVVHQEEVVVQEELQLEELFHLAHRVLPDLPPSNPEAGDGWQAINRLGALKSFLCQFSLLQECPEQHKSAWAKAHGYVLQRWRAALIKEEVDTALLWMGFLPQALLRKASRGGKVGRAQVAHRFNCVTIGDWGGLVEAWECDVKKMLEKKRDRRRDEVEGAEALARQRREVVGLIEDGQVSRAMQRITSHGLANIDDPNVLTQLRAKFPARQDVLPASVPLHSPIDSFINLRESLLSLDANRGSSPGCGGMRPEFLVALGDRMDEREMENLEEFGLKYVSGSLPAWLYRLWLTTQTVPMHKTSAQDAVRPIGIRHSWPRLFHKEVISQSKPEIREFLEPQQLGQSQAGAAKLIHSVRGLLEANPNFI